MNTLFLSQPDTDLDAWDLQLDSGGNLATKTGPEAVAQDVASAVKTFAGDLYYDQGQGIPYLSQVLGRPFSLPLVKAYLEDAALGVPTVVQARATITSLQGRKLSGSVEVIDEQGAALLAHF